MTEYCEFRDHLQQALRDRFVSGIKSAAIQRKLLSQEGLYLAKALSIAQGMEAAEAQLGQLRQVTGFSSQSSEEKEVHAVTTAGKRKGSHEKGQRKPCYRCGGTGHGPDKCFHKDKQCLKCKKKGHIARACKSTSSKESSGQGEEKREASCNHTSPGVRSC